MRAAITSMLALLGCAAVALGAATGASAAAASAQDKSFMTSNAQTNLAELSTAKLALARTQDEAVRKLATTIMKDHRKAQSELAAVARAAGFTLPTRPDRMQLTQAAALHRVAAAGFDASYLQIQADDHRTSIQKTLAEIRTGTDAAVVSYARTYLPVAQMHLGMANQAIVEGGGGASVVAPPSPLSTAPSPAVVTAGPLAHGAKTEPSSDTGWLIGLAVLVVLGLGGALLGLRRSATKHRG